jgi:hypothetical protein
MPTGSYSQFSAEASVRLPTGAYGTTNYPVVRDSRSSTWPTPASSSTDSRQRYRSDSLVFRRGGSDKSTTQPAIGPYGRFK